MLHSGRGGMTQRYLNVLMSSHIRQGFQRHVSAIVMRGYSRKLPSITVHLRGCCGKTGCMGRGRCSRRIGIHPVGSAGLSAAQSPCGVASATVHWPPALICLRTGHDCLTLGACPRFTSCRSDPSSATSQHPLIFAGCSEMLSQAPDDDRREGCGQITCASQGFPPSETAWSRRSRLVG